jgi:hypothetical protein
LGEKLKSITPDNEPPKGARFWVREAWFDRFERLQSFWCPLKCYVTFKIIIEYKLDNEPTPGFEGTAMIF